MGRMILTLGRTVWDKCGRNVTSVETSGNQLTPFLSISIVSKVLSLRFKISNNEMRSTFSLSTEYDLPITEDG